jgi:hypothetical protein
MREIRYYLDPVKTYFNCTTVKNKFALCLSFNETDIFTCYEMMLIEVKSSNSKN